MSDKKKKNRQQPIIVQTTQPSSAGKTNPHAIWIVVVVLLLIAFGYMWTQRPKGPNPLVEAVTNVADIPVGDYGDVPTPEPVTEVIESVSNIEPTPGAQSAHILATEIPWSTVQNLGNAGQMQTAMQNIVAGRVVDLRIGAVLTYGANEPYCINAHRPEKDPNRPLIDQVRDGSVKLSEGLRYCLAYSMIGELWAGVPQSSLNTFSLTAVDQITVDPEARVQTTTQLIDVSIRVPFGLQTLSVQPGNVVKTTYDEPGNFRRGMLDWYQEVIGGNGEEYTRLHMDLADTLAFELAQQSIIGGFFPDGSRDMSHLNELEELVRQAFETPSNDPNYPHPYDHLRAAAEVAALQAGYQGLGEFVVVLDWPYEPGVWYYLDTIGTATPLPVFGPNDYDKFMHNLFPLWRSEIYTPPPPIPQN